MNKKDIRSCKQEAKNSQMASQLHLAKTAFRSSPKGASWETFLEVAGLRQKWQEQASHSQELKRWAPPCH